MLEFLIVGFEVLGKNIRHVYLCHVSERYSTEVPNSTL